MGIEIILYQLSILTPEQSRWLQTTVASGHGRVITGTVPLIYHTKEPHSGSV
jgi:hypothetical protein